MASIKTRLGEKVEEAKVGFSSFHNLYNYLQTREHSANGTTATYNEDLLPSPPNHRKWKTIHYFAFYLTTTFSVGSYNLGATLVSIGLLWWHGMIAAVIGSFILTFVVVLNSRGALKYHLGYPAMVRSSAGLVGSKLFVCVRAIVAIIYFATQTYYGGRLMSVCLYTIFGQSFQNMPNTFPASAGITSKDLIGFMLFWLIQFPLMFIHPTHMRWLYVFKGVVTPTCLFGVLGWTVSKNGGLGNLTGLGKIHAEGSDLVWGMLQAINSVLAALCPILINAPDVARYASKPSDTVTAQFGAILISKVLVMFLGCATTSAAAGPNVVGQVFWNVWDLYGAILDTYWTPGARAGMFFASFGMMLAVIGNNVGTNSLPVGADLAGVWPRWINIRRGQVICALLAPLLVPWKIIANAASFLTFLGSYTVMLMPICGIMICDYYLIRKGNIHVPSIYDASPDGLYNYWHGWNLRAVAAWVAGVAFTIHGVAGSLSPQSVSDASKNMYKLGFILSGLMGFFVYWGLCLIWPVPVVPKSQPEKVLPFETLAHTEGFYPGESVEDIRGIVDGVSNGSQSGNEGIEKVNILAGEKDIQH